MKIPNIVAKQRAGLPNLEKGAELVQEPLTSKPLKVKNGVATTGSSRMVGGESPKPWKEGQRD